MVEFPEYRNFFFKSIYEQNFYLMKSGWWNPMRIWEEGGNYRSGDGYQHLWGELKYDENLIFVL